MHVKGFMLFRHWRLSGHSINQIGNAEEVTWVRPTDNGIAHGDHCRDYDVLDNELHRYGEGFKFNKEKL